MEQRSLTCPPLIRDIIVKTASFIHRNGPEFLENLKSKEDNKHNFSFLDNDNIYHAFYLQEIRKLSECEDVNGSFAQKPYQEKFKIIEKLKNPPSELEFILDPPTISALEQDVIKLTAQCVARNGRSFLMKLSNKEANNYEFDFLRPQHSHNAYFNKLIEQYAKIFLPSKVMLMNLDESIKDPTKFYDDALLRTEWIKHEQSNKHDEEDEKEKEKLIYKQIDWNFDNPIFVDLFSAQSYKPFVKRENVGSWSIEQEREQTRPVNKIKIVDDSVRGADTEIQDMEEDNDVEEFKVPTETQNDQIIVRKGYDPKARKQVESAPSNVFISPFTNEIVSDENLPVHMKIGLLNPNWSDQRNRSIKDKQEQGEVFTQGDSVSANLANIAKRRSDMFEQEKTSTDKQTDGQEKEVKEVWDGHSSSKEAFVQRANRNVSLEEQISDIHKSKGLLPDESKEKIGPSKPANVSIPTQNYIPNPHQTVIPIRPFPAVSHIPLGFPQHMMPMNQHMNYMTNMALAPSHPGLQGHVQMTHLRPAYDVEDEPLAKKSKYEDYLIPEDEFLARNPHPVRFFIQVPTVESSKATMHGQVLTLELPLSDTLSVVKAKVQTEINMPPGKQKLQLGNTVLKDNYTLAYYNLENNAVISLQTKERGGRKK